MEYISTRGESEKAGFKEILLSGMAPDGGLYLPSSFPEIDFASLSKFEGMSYSEIAAKIMLPFVGDSINGAKFHELVTETYESGKFRHGAVAPLVQVGPDAWILELFHGPTIAFKDYALQFLGKLFDHVLEERGEKITIVGATSGDTGSAAIEACRYCENASVFILHPEGRVSDVQRRQMTCVDSENVHNIAIKGNFDDCQALVKAMFSSPSFREEVNLSAVNSINWARIIAQTAYYVVAAVALGAPHRKVSFAVPTGNFGNVFAAYSARQMGLPVEKLIIGTNRNDILTRFFESGTMKLEGVIPTVSPSMDIQVSSNFERYLYYLLDCNAEDVSAKMSEFSSKGEFSVALEKLEKAQRDFIAMRCNEDETARTMKVCYEETGYLIDPHTAVGLNAAMQQISGDLSAPVVSLACAHPAKFPDAVEAATGVRPELPAHLSDLFDKTEYVVPLENDLEKVMDYIRSMASV